MSTEQKMSMLPESIATAITGRTSVVEDAERKKGQFEDAMFAAGFRADHCLSPKGKDSAISLSTPECWEQIKAAIVLGFPEKARGLMLKDTKTLSPEDSEEKRKWQQRINPNIRDLRNALILREIAAGERKQEEKENKPLEDKIVEQLVTLAKSAQKAEEPSFNVIGFIQALGTTAETIGIDAGIRFHLKLNGNQD